MTMRLILSPEMIPTQRRSADGDWREYAAIRYLDSTPPGLTTGVSDDTVIVLIVSVLMFVIAALPFIWLFLRAS